MYGSYGSYSSMGSLTQPLDIGSGSYLSRPAPSTSSYYHQSSCAYPSWPQRSSLDSPDYEERASSYLSDDDLFIYEDDLASPSGAVSDGQSSLSSSTSSSGQNPAAPAHGNFLGLNPPPTEEDVLAHQQQQMALQREAVRMLVAERERRRQAFKKTRTRTSYNKKSAKGKKGDMAPITESGE